MLSVTTKHPLDQLIEGVKRANDWSDPDLVKNAKERNHVLSKSNISRMRGDLVSIKADVIYALAAGLRVSPAQVAIAAVESMGIALPRYESPTPEQAVRMDASLSAKDKALVLGLLKQMRDAGTGAANQSQEVGLLDESEEGSSLRRIEERLSPHGIGIHDADDAVDKRGRPGARGV